MVATHFVSDCFLYNVVGDEVFKDENKLSKGIRFTQEEYANPTGNVIFKPLSYFSCGNSSLAANNDADMHPVDMHIPDKLHDNVFEAMLYLSQKAMLFWLPACKKFSENLAELK